MYIKYILYSLIFLFSINSAAQVDSLTKFYYKDGSLASVGKLRNGKPDGYWKTYHPNGILKSEGNREFYQLDGLWIFYDEKGLKTKEINYEAGIRNGRENLFVDGVLYQSIDYKNNIKEGKFYKYYENDSISYEADYLNNEIYGKAYEYSRDGRIITIEDYKDGVLKRKQKINRLDNNNEKHGLWVWFNKNRVITLQGTYKHGLKHGYFKNYDNRGNLLKTVKYINGEIQEDAIETAKLEVKRTYYPDKSVKSYKSFRNGIADGVHQEFDKNGKASSTILYKLGVVVAKGGSIDEKGNKQGTWKQFYESGEVLAEGDYLNGKKHGQWQYFYISGKLEQTGKYEKGKAEGNWIWYYENGEVLRSENFVAGKEEGISTEYDINGNVIAEGEYYEGFKEGEWVFINDIYKTTGEYEEGRRSGMWKQVNTENNKVVSEITYYEGMLDGAVKYYYDSGIIKVEGRYESDLKQGDWNYYNEQGVNTLTVRYIDGVDVRYNNIDAIKLN